LKVGARLGALDVKGFCGGTMILAQKTILFREEVIVTVDFKILGTCAGTGVPSFFCDCIGCKEARLNPKYARTRTGAYMNTGKDHLLIDAPPDILHQLVREKITKIDTIFLTHWHADHYSGLGEFEYYVKLSTGEPVTLYMPESAVEEFRSTFPDLIDVFQVIPWEYGQAYNFGEVSLTPLKANHGIETAGFLVTSKETRLAYFPDTAGFPAETAEKLQGIDYLVCDATLYGENWFPHSHMTVQESIAAGRGVGARKIILTHLSIHYSEPVTTAQLEEELSTEPDVSVAYDGLSIPLL